MYFFTTEFERYRRREAFVDLRYVSMDPHYGLSFH